MKMQDKKLKKFNIYSKVTNVLFILVIVFGALLTLAGIGMSIYLNVADFDIAEAANFIFENELPGASLILPTDYETVRGIAYFIVINMAISFAFTAYVIKMISNMFKHIVADQTPFTQNTVRAAKSIGASFLIYTGVIFIISLAIGFMQTSLKVHINIEWGTLLIGLLVIALGEMFEFGTSLQEDSESIL